MGSSRQEYWSGVALPWDSVFALPTWFLSLLLFLKGILRGGPSLVVQCLGLWASTAGVIGLILGWGTKIPHATWHGKKKKKNHPRILGGKWLDALKTDKQVSFYLFLVGNFCHQNPLGFPGKESACNAGDLGSIPGLGRSPAEGNGYPLQYFGLENSKDYSMRSQRVRHNWATFTFCHWDWVRISKWVPVYGGACLYTSASQSLFKALGLLQSRLWQRSSPTCSLLTSLVFSSAWYRTIVYEW